eukprot:scaffold320_cov367-Pinguiococcus_pyrenoidosus.AAC.10
MTLYYPSRATAFCLTAMPFGIQRRQEKPVRKKLRSRECPGKETRGPAIGERVHEVCGAPRKLQFTVCTPGRQIPRGSRFRRCGPANTLKGFGIEVSQS